MKTDFYPQTHPNLTKLKAVNIYSVKNVPALR